MGAVIGKRPSRPRRADLEAARVSRLGQQGATNRNNEPQTHIVDNESEHERNTNEFWHGGDDGEDEQEDDIEERRNRNIVSRGEEESSGDECGYEESGGHAEASDKMYDPGTSAVKQALPKKKKKGGPVQKKRVRGPGKKKQMGKVISHAKPTRIPTGLVELTQIQARHELELDQIALDQGLLQMHRQMWLKYREAYVKTGIFPGLARA